jgi:LAGLIDADG DNA endonuclease family protein
MLKVHEIPPDIGYYLAGFTDGEGSFNVSFRPRSDYKSPWKISLCFNISQRDPVILAQFKRYLGCGTMRQRHDGVWYYEVNNLVPIVENVIPFFERFGFLSAKKKRDFAKFKQLAELIRQGRHHSLEGVKEVLHIRREMNDGGKRRYFDEAILQRFENPQRPYAGPGKVSSGMIWPELHGDVQSATEMSAPSPDEKNAGEQ